MMRKGLMAAILLAGSGGAAQAAPVSSEIEAAGPLAPLHGTLLLPEGASAQTPVVLIIPGSGPTDRDGNSPLGINANIYKLLAEALAEKGVASVRIDKRGMFGSKAAVADANKVTIADYVTDTHSWAAAVKAKTGAKCIWIAGHSEGGLVGMAAAQGSDSGTVAPADICGVAAISAPGRKLGDVIRAQLAAAKNVELLEQADEVIGKLESGFTVDASKLAAPLQGLFADAVQPYLIDLLAQDTAKLAAGMKGRLAIIQGLTDIQTGESDARLLAKAQPRAKLMLLPDVNHVLKHFAGDDRRANFATYAQPELPVDASVVDAVAGFVKGD